MKQKMLAISLCLFAIIPMVYAQNSALPDNKATISSYYQLALKYKNGEGGIAPDYTKAYRYFSEAAALGDEQSIYAMGYLTYKGLGCTQDYTTAAKLFAKGAFQGRDNSMYFYALCWRNGYGLVKNDDSARYWLNKAVELGYPQAIRELQMTVAENNNSDSMNMLVRQISSAAIPIEAPLNQFKKVQHHLPPAELIAGYYTGYVIQYDWSGQNVVSSKKLTLNLTGHDKQLEGYWHEDDIDSFKINASLALNAVTFAGTTYARKDHYSPTTAITYNFQNANLSLVQKGDSVFLAGNVNMFSPDRNEPSKPLMVVLFRVDPSLMTSNGDLGLKASPNPFQNSLNVEFTLKDAAIVAVDLVALNGTVVYHNNAGTLEAGNYLLPLAPSNITSGVYFLKLLYNAKTAVIKVVKN
jgi:hypothetical protein